MACDSEVTVFEKDTASAPKRQDAWKCYGSGGYVEFVDVYNNTEGRIKYKLPLSIVARYLNVTQGYIYESHKSSDYKFTLECTVVFYGFQSNAIKVQTCIEPIATPTPTPTPIPQKGSISCITNPSGANVYIDNNTFWKKTNCLVPDVEPGYHKVGYTLPGYKDYVTTIHVAEGQTRVVSVNLVKIYTPTPTPTPTPAPTVGTIRCITSPTGATVIHNGSPYLIPTNCTIAQVPAGNQMITLTKSGYNSEIIYFYLNPGQVYTVSKTLRPAPTPTPTPTPLPTTGDISCITLPTGANVYIDNNTFWKKTNCLVSDVDVGYHKVGYTLTGYMDYVKTIYLSPGETEIVSTTLVKVQDTASIKATCNVLAYVKMDNEPSRRTPYTFSNLVQGSYHTLLFHEVGYISQTKQVKAEVGTTIHVNLIPVSAVGFNITVNIPGLSSNQIKKLWVEPVTKIPFTDTWIPAGVHGGIQWERAYNRQYLARDSNDKCDPQPNKYFTGSTNKLEPNKDYAIFVGDTVLSTYPDNIVYNSGSSTPVNVTLTSDYYDWLSRRVCGFIGVSEAQCSNWFGALFVDIATPIADLYVIFNHRSLYTNEPETPTGLTYFCAALGCIPGGGVIKQAGKIKYTDELADIAKAARESTNIRDALKNGDFIRKFDSLSNNDIQSILVAALSGDTNRILSILKNKPLNVAYDTLDATSDNIKAVTSTDLSYKTMAEALDFATSNGYKLLETLKGVESGKTSLTSTTAGELMNLGANTPSDMHKIITTLTPTEIARTVPKLKQSSYTPVKVAGSMVDDVNLIVRDFNPPRYETAEDAIRQLGKSAEQVKTHPSGHILYSKFIDGTINYVEKVSPILKDGLKVDTTEEAVKILKKATYNPVSSWNPKVPDAQASLLNRITTRIKEDPGMMITLASGVSILALWFIHENAEEMLGIEATTRGKDSPSDISWKLKDKMGVIDTNYWNLKAAEDAQNWTTYCTVLILYEQSIEEYKSFGELNKTNLESEGTYTTFKSFSDAYDIALELKRAVHSCGLPATFTATIASYIDGDSIKIRYDNNIIECRLVGINTPENKGYTYSCTENQEDFLVRRLTAYGKACIEETIWNVDQPMYDFTVDLIKALLPINISVTIKIDKNNELDKHGRTLVVIHRLNKNINIEMLKAGMAVVFFYSQNSRVDTTEFLAAEHIGSNNQYGIWSFAEGTGSIHCNSGDKTACRIWLDGGDTGEQTVNNEFTLKNVIIGTHEVAFTKTVSGVDYICFVHNIQVYKNQTAQASCTLKPSGQTPTPTPYPCPNPTASFDMAPSTPKDGDNVSLDGTDSSPGTGHWISKFEWILNQVTIGTGIFHSFVATIGDHLLTLKTTNDCGNVDSATKSFSVSAASCPRPTASFVNTPTSPEINEYMYTNASDSSGDPGAEIQRYEWYVDEVLVSTGETANFIFSTVGTKSLKLKVINTCGSSDTKTKYITVKEPAACPKPTASFINTPSSPKVNEYMYADASGSSGDATAPIELYEWYVDDVLVQTGMTTSIIFSTVGTKLLKLNVINSCGESDVKTKYISVSDQTPLTCPNPTASFVMSPSSPNINENVTLSASDSKGGTGHSISNYEWVLDGSSIGYGVTKSFSATQGNHILQLKIKNDCGKEDSVTKTFNVGPSACPNPLASFIMAPTSPKVGNEVIMDASTSKGGSGSFISEYKWYINNVLIGMGKLQSFTAKAGTFILKLEVINECANSDFVSKSFTVSEPTTLPGPTGTIYCRSQNQTACEIWLDEIYTGKKTVSNVYLLEDIPIGPHIVTFKKMIKGVQHTCSVSLTVIENKQAQADCAVSSETVFPIDFKSNPLNAIITKQ